MRCEFEAQVEAYHDGELEPARVDLFEDHVQTCSACAAQLRSLQSMTDLIAANLESHRPPMSYDALQRVHDEIDSTMDRSLLPLTRGLIGIAAAVLIVATAGLWQMQPQQASEPQPWEGTVLTSSSAQVDTSQPNGNVLDPDIIVADLSRRSLH